MLRRRGHALSAQNDHWRGFPSANQPNKGDILADRDLLSQYRAGLAPRRPSCYVCRRLGGATLGIPVYMSEQTSRPNTSAEMSGSVVTHPAALRNFTWEKHCGGSLGKSIAVAFSNSGPPREYEFATDTSNERKTEARGRKSPRTGRPPGPRICFVG